MKSFPTLTRSRSYLELVLSLLFVLSYTIVATAQEAIIPRPVTATSGQGKFILNPDTVIVADRKTRLIGELLRDWLKQSTGYCLRLNRGTKTPLNSISLMVDPTLSGLGDEGYVMDITSERAVLRARKSVGAFYGVESLRQLLPPEVFADTIQDGVEWSIPSTHVEDYPRFKWRGALLDLGRHFMPKEFVLKFIDLLALYKMNVLHLHLTDDQGWRIEIKKYPNLTKIGSTRRESPLENAVGFDGTPHGGFYAQEAIKQIVAYAKRRFITIVPEIEMPGHATAAIASYPELGNTGQRLEVSTHWGVHQDIYNVNEKTFHFLQNVLKEVMALFPSEFICIGGDEVPKDQWKASLETQARIKAVGLKDEEELQSYFIRRMDEFLTSHGRRLIGWDEILNGGELPSGAAVMSWHGLDGGIKAARAGHDVVMAAKQYTYFDFAQSKDPGVPFNERRYVPLEKVYSFEPIPSELSADEAKRILGAQGQLWTEHIPNPQRLEYMAFPRLIALAEVTWTPRERRDYAGFLQRLKKHETLLKTLNVNFRPLDTDQTASQTVP